MGWGVILFKPNVCTSTLRWNTGDGKTQLDISYRFWLTNQFQAIYYLYKINLLK